MEMLKESYKIGKSKKILTIASTEENRETYDRKNTKCHPLLFKCLSKIRQAKAF